MHRIDHSTAAVGLPTPDPAGTPGYFTEGDPVGGTPATIVTADWANAVQEELIYTITQGGLSPSKSDRTQLKQAIDALIQTGIATALAARQPSRNVVVNGAMRIAQMGATFAAAASGDYTLDQWRVRKSGAAVATVSRDTDVPTVGAAGRLFAHSLKVDITTADASIGAGDFFAIEQPIEGNNYLALAQRACVLSFWVKAPKTGTYCVYLNNSGRDRSLVGQYVINAANTWERKEITLAASPSGGTWNYGNGVGVYLGFMLSCGSTFQNPAGAWATGEFYGSSNQVNATDDIANDFFLTGVQLEAGSAATEFEAQDIDTVIGRCQRYLQKSYNIDVDPGTNTAAGATTFTAVDTDANLFGADRPLIVQMRGTPSVTCYSTDTGTANRVYNTNTAGNQTVNNVAGAGQSSTGYPSLTTNPSAGDNLRWQWVADARLT